MIGALAALDLARLLPPFALVDTRHEYLHVFWIYVPIALGVFGLILVATLVCVFVFRRRPAERAARWHENKPAEGGYALLLTLTIAFLLYITFTAEHKVDTVANEERPALTINVIASKWEWTFNYPDQHVTVRSGTTGRRTLVVPTGEAVKFRLISEDVIHAFWIPELDYKHDVIPGRTMSQILTFSRAGFFQGQCAEFCGLRHADMVYNVEAVSPARFRAWAAAGARTAPS